MKCKDHPRYQGKRMPRADCIECWKLYRDEELDKALTFQTRITKNISRLIQIDLKSKSGV